MQASKVNGYITNEGRLVLDAPLSLPPGKVEVIVLSEGTNALRGSASKEAGRSGSPDVQVSYRKPKASVNEVNTPEQAAEREKLNQRLTEECRQLAAMNFDDIGTDEEWTRVQNEALFALEEECVEEEKNGNS